MNAASNKKREKTNTCCIWIKKCKYTVSPYYEPISHYKKSMDALRYAVHSVIFIFEICKIFSKRQSLIIKENNIIYSFNLQ